MKDSVCRVASLIALIAVLATSVVAAQQPVPPGTPDFAAPAQALPIQNVLNMDGTLALGNGAAGSFDASGWQMRTDADGTPRFVPESSATAAGDERWAEEFALPGVLSGEVRAVAASGSDIYIGGSFDKKHIPNANSLLRWDGRWHAVGGGVRVWSQSGTWVRGQINALAVSANRLYVGGVFSRAGDVPVSNIAMWDGSSWYNLGGGVQRGGSQEGAQVHALVVDGNNVYVGGTFDSAGGVAASSVARWNGTSWSALGAGLRGDIITPLGTAHALTMSSGSLYAGGWFTSAGGVAAEHIARWNGSSWAALGSGVDHATTTPGVYALTSDGTNVYAGGRFEQAGSISAANIARWNGTSWSALGGGISGVQSGELPVQALAFTAGQLYVGGRFNTAGGMATRGLARWNGTSWADWGGGTANVEQSVFEIEVVDGSLYVGGDFTLLGDRWMSYIGRWDGDEWRALGQGVHTDGGAGTIRAVAVNSSGEVYVAGLFDYAGEIPAHNVARWDGERWWGMGSGTDGIAHALAVSGDQVFVGGWFTRAGGVPVKNIARWNAATQSWSALGAGSDDQVNALAIGNRTLFVGGGLAIGWIKRWHLDTNTWTTASGSFEASVTSLAARGDWLFIGGKFLHLYRPGEAVAVSGVAIWDSASDNWYYIEDNGRRGVYPPYVYAVTLLDNSLYVGGYFVSAGPVPANNIAQFDLGTGRWSALGSGVGGGMLYVQALAGSGSDLFVGGDFDTAGGQTANNIARWNVASRSWSALGSGVNGDGFPEVNALAMSAGSVFVGGAFETAGLLPGHNLSRWTARAPSASTVITAASGGKLEADGVTVQFPAGAVSTNVTVSYLPMPLRVTFGHQWAVRGFVLEARTSEGRLVTQFLRPVTLRVSYSESQLKTLGLTEESLQLTYWNGSTLVPIPTTVDKLNNHATVSIDHLTEFALVGSTVRMYVYLPLVRR